MNDPLACRSHVIGVEDMLDLILYLMPYPPSAFAFCIQELHGSVSLELLNPVLNIWSMKGYYLDASKSVLLSLELTC